MLRVSGIEIGIQETVRNNPAEIFELLWSQEICDIIVK